MVSIYFSICSRTLLILLFQIKQMFNVFADLQSKNKSFSFEISANNVRLFIKRCFCAPFFKVCEHSVEFLFTKNRLKQQFSFEGASVTMLSQSSMIVVLSGQQVLEGESQFVLYPLILKRKCRPIRTCGGGCV